MGRVREFGSRMGGLGCGGLLLGAIGGAALLGPDWEEGGDDAGNTLNTSISIGSPPGNPPLNSISGCLGCDAGQSDFEDIFLIFIGQPSLFQVSTVPSDGGWADFDSKILVFDAGGRALLGNDNYQAGEPYSRVGPEPTAFCKVNIEITEPGAYFVAITSSGRNATVEVNSEQVPAFPTNDPNAIFCATSDGYTNQLGGWEGAGQQGAYTLALSGVTGVPTCVTDCPADFNADGRVDGVDLGYLMANWNTATCVDLAGGPVLTAEDLGILLASWGGC